VQKFVQIEDCWLHTCTQVEMQQCLSIEGVLQALHKSKPDARRKLPTITRQTVQGHAMSTTLIDWDKASLDAGMDSHAPS